MKDKFFRLVVCLCLVGSYFFLPKYGFTAFNATVVPAASAAGLPSHLLYPISHANIYHLAANILCLWMLRCPMHLLATYLIAVLASFLPSFSLYDIAAVPAALAAGDITMGFSGVLFAMVGISWGNVHRFRDMLSRNKWYLIIPAFLPHVNFLIHIYCLLAGYLYGMLCAKKSKNS